MTKEEAAKLLGDALEESHRGFMSFAQKMSRPGIKFTRWQRWRIKFWLWLGKPHRAQRIVLRAMRR